MIVLKSAIHQMTVKFNFYLQLQSSITNRSLYHNVKLAPKSIHKPTCCLSNSSLKSPLLSTDYSLYMDLLYVDLFLSWIWLIFSHWRLSSCQSISQGSVSKLEFPNFYLDCFWMQMTYKCILRSRFFSTNNKSECLQGTTMLCLTFPDHLSSQTVIFWLVCIVLWCLFV